MITLVRYATASAIAALALSTAAVGATTGSIDTTGPDSYNKVKSENRVTNNWTNNNSVSASNNNPQNASTGDAKVKHNTTGGDASTGDATNESMLDASLSVSNGSGGDGGGIALGEDEGTIENTGPDSTNVIKFKNVVRNTVTNNNSLSVSNTNSQNASSGDARVSGNTTGGDASTGDATNTSSTTIMFEVSN